MERMAMTLDKFTRSLDAKSLPRVLQIQSGYYFQGSVYELYGGEWSFSYGELLKIIGINITRLIVELQSEGSKSMIVNLSLDYPGLFRIVADKRPYASIQEIVDSVRIGPECLGHPEFHCPEELQLAEGTIQAEESFRLTALRTEHEDSHVDCEVTRKDSKHIFTVKLSHTGEFYECADDQFYTLRELVEWKIPKGRKRTVTWAKSLPSKEKCVSELPEDYSGELVLTPVYELQTVSKFGKNVVFIPSTLDVEVLDVTEECDGDCFMQPLSFRDVFAKPSEFFPFRAEIIEPPSQVQEELGFLKSSKQVIVHSAYQAKRILASEIRSEAQRRFLIPVSYNGRFKRRPRTFPTAYDLEVAKSNMEQLHVVATKAFETHYEGLSSVLVGDQYLVHKRETSEVIYGGKRKTVEALACEKIVGKKYEAVLIPMCLDGGFVEVVHDKKQYMLSEVCQRFALPFNVKVSMRDLSVKEDLLAGATGLQLEEEITDPFLIVSTPDLAQCWEVPVNRTNMALQLLERWNGPKLTQGKAVPSAVEEIGEDCYFTLRRYVNTSVLPPPRPPKRPQKHSEDTVKLPPPRPKKPVPPSPKSPHTAKPAVSTSRSSICVEQNTTPPRKETSNTSLITMPDPGPQKVIGEENSPQHKTIKQDDDDTHDYEYIDEDELDIIRRKLNDQSIQGTDNRKTRNTYAMQTAKQV
ncbi:protein THEMIS [Coregonus clupeaformis]|uniref:protein THEMIS n=1 Tax=Coregonus clupeaformis TaxID=59861 RepID=UPI001E1C7011|nr:protein THEMIS [Coregonus clupeaformis]